MRSPIAQISMRWRACCECLTGALTIKWADSVERLIAASTH